MGSARMKTQIYMLIVSLIVSLLSLAIVKIDRSKPVVRETGMVSSVQRLKALEKAAPQSPEMSRFLKHEEAAEEANQQAAEGLTH